MGKTVKMEGRVSGSQPLTVTWYKDNNEIYGSDKYDVSFKNNIAELGIRDSSSSDSGVYTCAASNEAGKASCRVSLTISGMSLSVYLHYLTFTIICLKLTMIGLHLLLCVPLKVI